MTAIAMTNFFSHYAIYLKSLFSFSKDFKHPEKSSFVFGSNSVSFKIFNANEIYESLSGRICSFYHV